MLQGHALHNMVWDGHAQDGQLLPMTWLHAHWLSGGTGLHANVCRARCLCMALCLLYVRYVTDML